MRAALVAFAVLRFGLKLELGPEFDSNANRAETYVNPPQVPATDTPPPGPIPSFLVRTTGTGTVAWASGPNTLRVGLTTGAKIFTADAAAPQNVFVLQAAADDTLRAAAPLLLGLSADYYDATQLARCPDISTGGQLLPDTSCHRDFRTGGLRASAILLDGDYDLTLSAGARTFGWKPDENLSFEGTYVAATAAAHLRSGPPDDESEWDFAMTGRLEWRWYHGPRLDGPTDLGTPGNPHRRDIDALGSITLSHVGKLLAALSYTIDFDRSTSYGQTFLRHILGMKLAFALPFRITATTKFQLVFTGYAQPAVLSSGTLVPLTIDDENRDAIVIDLERPLGAGFAISARFSTYRNGVSNAVLEYVRHVGYLGISYKIR